MEKVINAERCSKKDDGIAAHPWYRAAADGKKHTATAEHDAHRP
jgi:hypothetical protein